MRKAGLIAALVALSTVLGASVTSAQTAPGFGGFYIGAHGGYGIVNDTGDEDVEGGLGGLHAGYNAVSGVFLYGIEADYDWSDISYTVSDTYSGQSAEVRASLNYFASIRGRLGWLYDARTLFYATAGYSWSEIEGKVTISGLGSASESFDLDGAVAGGGFEYKFSNSLSARLEGLRYWGGNDDLGDEDAEIDVIRAGLSYYFK